MPPVRRVCRAAFTLECSEEEEDAQPVTAARATGSSASGMSLS
jgi:hypothetical protein